MENTIRDQNKADHQSKLSKEKNRIALFEKEDENER